MVRLPSPFAMSMVRAGSHGQCGSGLYPDRLDVQVLVLVLHSGLAAVAAHLVAAERHRGIHGLISVDPDRTGADAFRRAMRLADIARPDAAAEAELRLVAVLDHFLDVGE